MGQATPSKTTFLVADISTEVQRTSTLTPVGGSVVMTASRAGTWLDHVVTGAAMVNVQLLVAVLPAASAHADRRGVRGEVGDGAGVEAQGGGGRVVGGGHGYPVDGGAEGGHT